MSDDNEDAEFQCQEPFGVDDGQLANVSRETAFVLGVEWQMVATQSNRSVGFDRPIHTENAVRIGQMLRRRGREFRISAYCEDDSWLEVRPEE